MDGSSIFAIAIIRYFIGLIIIIATIASFNKKNKEKNKGKNTTDFLSDYYKKKYTRTEETPKPNNIDIPPQQPVLEENTDYNVPVTTQRTTGESISDFLSDYVVIDLETTGLNPKSDRIIEIAAVKVLDDNVTEQYQTLINPGFEISGFITSLTGITNDMLADAPPIEKVFNNFIEFVGGSVVVAHNANFDINFIYDNYMRLSKKEFKNNFIDTMRISRRLYSYAPSHRLVDLAERFKIEYKTKHRAIEDCIVTHKCYQYMKSYVPAKINFSYEQYLDDLKQKMRYNNVSYKTLYDMIYDMANDMICEENKENTIVNDDEIDLKQYLNAINPKLDSIKNKLIDISAQKDISIENTASIIDKKGMDFERTGNLCNAILAYEAYIYLNLKYPITHPYERLTVIYRKHKLYEEELRIISLAKNLYKGSTYDKLISRKETALQLLNRVQKSEKD